MTLIAGSMNYNGEIAIIADTVVTSENVPFEKNLSRTSRGETIQPLVVGEKKINFFTEGACKIGQINSNVGVAVAGDLKFIENILQLVLVQADQITSLVTLENVCRIACKSLESSELQNESIADFIFGSVFSSNYRISRAVFTRHVSGDISLDFFNGQLDASNIVVAEAAGSGAEMVNYAWSSPVFCQNYQIPNMLPAMLGFEFSAKISEIQANAAAGVGGAFLGICITSNGVRFQEDAAYIKVNPDGIIKSMSKVIYREGYFFIMDFVSRHLKILSTLNTRITCAEWDNSLIEKYRNQIISFSVSHLLIDERDSQNPLRPKFIINNVDPNDSFVSSSRGKVKASDSGEFNPIPGSEICISVFNRSNNTEINKKYKFPN